MSLGGTITRYENIWHANVAGFVRTGALTAFDARPVSRNQLHRGVPSIVMLGYCLNDDQIDGQSGGSCDQWHD